MEKFKLEPVSGGYITVPASDEHSLLSLLHNGEPSGEVKGLCQFDSVEIFIHHLRSVAMQYGLTIKVLWRRGAKATLGIEREVLTIPSKAIALTEQLKARGLPFSAWVMPDGTILTGLPLRSVTLGKTAARRGRATYQQVASALDVLAQRFADPDHSYFNLDDFLWKQDAESPYEYGRNLYKATACGPWVSYTTPADKRGYIYYEDPLARRTKAKQDWWASCTGIEIGSIVEGSDVEVGPTKLVFPFTEDELEKVVAEIDAEAGFYWDRDNSTYYNVCNAQGELHLACVWADFDDAPTGTWAEDDEESLELAKRAGETLFSTGPHTYEDLIPIPGTSWFVQELPTPDLIY